MGSCNKTHINNLEKLHARAGRIVYGLPWGNSAEEVLTRTGWDSLETTYKFRLTEFFCKCINDYLKSFFTEEFRPQKKWKHHSSKTRNDFIRNSIRYRGSTAWNSFTNKETRVKTLKEFKRCLAKFYTDKMNLEPILATLKTEILVTNIFNSF